MFQGSSNTRRHVFSEEDLLHHLFNALMHCPFYLSMGTLIEVVLGLMDAATARARARLCAPSYLDFLVAHVQPVVHHLSRPDGLVLR